MSEATTAGPVRERERILSLDVCRGFALLGIFFVNMGLFAQPFVYMLGDPAIKDAPLADQLAWWFVRGFCELKFISTFSLLFGAGIAMQFVRAEAVGKKFMGQHMRRMLMLGIIGFLHWCVLWYGDILFLYACLGCMLPLFVRASPRNLIRGSALCLVVGAVLIAGLTAVQVLFVDMDAMAAEVEEGETLLGLDAIVASPNPMSDVWRDAEIVAYRDGPILDQFIFRIILYLNMLLGAPFSFGWHVMAMFLLGMAFMKTGFFEPGARQLQGRVALAGLAIGVPIELFQAWCVWAGDFEIGAWYIVSAFVREFGSVALCLGYIGTVCWIASSGILRPVLKLFANAGRLALTVYLSETIIATFLMYSWGLGWFGSVPKSEQVTLVLIIYTCLVAFAGLWLIPFRMGPIEWLWRTMTYGTRQPLLRDRSGDAA